jgi:hypothetical protein
MFETGTRSPTAEGVVPGGETPQTPLNPFLNPEQVPGVSPQSSNLPTSPEGNSTTVPGDSTAWGGLALPLFSPNPNLNPTETPNEEESSEATSPAEETPILSSPTPEEAMPTESGETPNPASSPSATPTTEGTTDSPANP